MRSYIGFNLIRGRLSRYLSIAVGTLCLAACYSVNSKEPQWTGKGNIRILVKTPVIMIGNRAEDEMPARTSIRFKELLSELNITGTVDLSMLPTISLVEVNNPPGVLRCINKHSAFSAPAFSIAL